jgi:hypothetical protein
VPHQGGIGAAASRDEGHDSAAEEYPEMSLTKVRLRMIEKCAPLKISGPFYLVQDRARNRS